MTLVEEGRVRLDQPVAAVLPEFGGRRKIAPYPNPLRIDPTRALVFACLTSHVYYGRTGEDTLTPFRATLAQTIVRCIQ